MSKLLEKIRNYKASWRGHLNSRVLFVVIGVLTVFNLAANLFNSYMAFTGKADQQELHKVQREILSNQDRLELQQRSIEKLQTKQKATDARADKSDARQTKNEADANK